MANLRVFFSDVVAFLCSVKVAKRIDVISRQHAVLDTDNVSRVHSAQSFARSMFCRAINANSEQFANCTRYFSIWSHLIIWLLDKLYSLKSNRCKNVLSCFKDLRSLVLWYS
jgi:hypothetical protein